MILEAEKFVQQCSWRTRGTWLRSGDSDTGQPCPATLALDLYLLKANWSQWTFWTTAFLSRCNFGQTAFYQHCCTRLWPDFDWLYKLNAAEYLKKKKLNPHGEGNKGTGHAEHIQNCLSFCASVKYFYSEWKDINRVLNYSWIINDCGFVVRLKHLLASTHDWWLVA